MKMKSLVWFGIEFEILSKKKPHLWQWAFLTCYLREGDFILKNKSLLNL